MRTAPPISVLIVEDEPGQARLIEISLEGNKRTPFRCELVETLAEAWSILATRNFEVILLDLTLPDSSGAATVEKFRARFPSLPIVVLTGVEDDDLGIYLVQLGVQDFIPKGQMTPALLHRTLRYAVERQIAVQERERLLRELSTSLAEVKVLSGLIPICAQCKKVRDDSGYWDQVEHFISGHSAARFSHSICPDCAKVLYPGFDIYPGTTKPPETAETPAPERAQDSPS